MPIDVGDTIVGLDLLARRMQTAARQTVADSLHLFQAAAMHKAPVGVAGNSTNAPGDLARSIDVEGPVGGGGTYTGRVGPTIVYGRQRELGGEIVPRTARLLVFTKFGTVYMVPRVYQHPEPYLKPAVTENLANAWAIALGRAREAIAGS